METLHFNMLSAGADYLYGLPQRGTIRTAEKRLEIGSMQSFQDRGQRKRTRQKRSLPLRQRKEIPIFSFCPLSTPEKEKNSENNRRFHHSSCRFMSLFSFL